MRKIKEHRMKNQSGDKTKRHGETKISKYKLIKSTFKNEHDESF